MKKHFMAFARRLTTPITKRKRINQLAKRKAETRIKRIQEGTEGTAKERAAFSISAFSTGIMGTLRSHPIEKRKTEEKNRITAEEKQKIKDTLKRKQ